MIRKSRRLLRLPHPNYDEDINLALKRVRRQKPNRPRQVEGFMRSFLDAFLEVPPGVPWGVHNWAMLSLSYDLLTRRFELVALHTDDLEMPSDGTLRVLIRRSKVDPFGQVRIAFTSRRTANLVQVWLFWRSPDIL